MKLSSCFASLLLAAAGAVSTPSAMAVPIAYEGFNYAAGSALVGSNGGSGFSGAWENGLFSGGAPFGVGTGSLAYPGIASNGNSGAEIDMAGYWGARRDLASSLGADGTTAYVSFLMRAGPDATAADFFGVDLESADPNYEVFVGKGGGGDTSHFVIERRGGADQVASDDLIGTSTQLLVLKMVFAAGVDTLSLFVNPVLGLGEPAVADAVNSLFDTGAIAGFGLFGSHGWAIDEIRIGTTMADVMPMAVELDVPAPGQVPEPATWALLLPALLGLQRKQRHISLACQGCSASIARCL